MSVEFKYCSCCHSNKNIELFYKQIKTGTKLMKTCGKCREYKDRAGYMREYRKIHPQPKCTRNRTAERREYMKQYRMKQKAKKLESAT